MPLLYFLESNSIQLWKIRENWQGISDSLYRPKDKKRKGSVTEALRKNIKYYSIAGKSKRLRDDWFSFNICLRNVSESKQSKE